ncbi:MAG: MATE family efflux transporter, partial [Merdibacter sp.]
ARVSEAALNAVSICYPVQMIMVAVACGTGVGINALLSRPRRTRSRTAEQVAMHGLFLAACSWIVFALIGLFCAEAFLSLFASDAEIMAMGVSYMQICTICSIGVFAEIAYERIMQSTGNPIYNMIIQGAGALINIILDPILIFGMFGLPQMGVSGAALATVIGQIAAMFLGAYCRRCARSKRSRSVCGNSASIPG